MFVNPPQQLDGRTDGEVLHRSTGLRDRHRDRDRHPRRAAIPNLPIATSRSRAAGRANHSKLPRRERAGSRSTVAQPIAAAFVALDGMHFSRSSNDGVLTVDVTFDLGTNVDGGGGANPESRQPGASALPSEVQREGVTVKKLSTAILLGMAFTSDDRNATFLNNFVTINVLDRIACLMEKRPPRARITACGCGSIREDGDARRDQQISRRLFRLRTARTRRAPSASRQSRPVSICSIP